MSEKRFPFLGGRGGGRVRVLPRGGPRGFGGAEGDGALGGGGALISVGQLATGPGQLAPRGPERPRGGAPKKKKKKQIRAKKLGDKLATGKKPKKKSPSGSGGIEGDLRSAGAQRGGGRLNDTGTDGPSATFPESGRPLGRGARNCVGLSSFLQHYWGTRTPSRSPPGPTVFCRRGPPRERSSTLRRPVQIRPLSRGSCR